MQNPSAAVPGLEATLTALGIRGIKRKTGGFMALCPFHQEHRPSFSISDHGLWKCWAGCGAGNFWQLNNRLGADTKDWRNSLKILKSSLDFQKVKDGPRKFVNMPKGFSPYSFLEEVPANISSRLTWETIEKFFLGSASDKNCYNRCIVPIFFKHRCVGWHARALKPGMLRYYNPTDFAIKDYVFNYDNCPKGGEVIVVEGAFNAMSMTEKGFPNTVAVFGIEFKAPQIEKLFSLNPSTVIICFDRDPSKVDPKGVERGRNGQRAALKLGNMIQDLAKVEVMILPFGLDPNDLSPSIIKKCYDSRVPIEKLLGA